MTIVDGKAIAQKVLSTITPDLTRGPVFIAAVYVGENESIKSFVEIKKKLAESIGMKMENYYFKSNTPEEEVVNKLENLAQDESVDGIIVELPVPEHFDRDRILNAVPVEKDIDVLSAKAQEKFYNNISAILPPAVKALEMLFDEHPVNFGDKTAAVFGQGILIGKPVSHWLEKRCKKVWRIDEDTEDAEKLSVQADIIVSGVGKPNLIKGEMVKTGAIVIDFGFEKLENGKIAGDVEFDSVSPKSSLITPVPRGMGPLAIAAFLKNAASLTSL